MGIGESNLPLGDIGTAAEDHLLAFALQCGVQGKRKTDNLLLIPDDIDPVGNNPLRIVAEKACKRQDTG